MAEALSPFTDKLRSSGISLNLEIPADLPPIPLDAHLMNRVFQLLIENALEAMPAGGTLTLSAALESRSLKISLRDSGVGIAPETLPLIFDPFFSTKPQGTGMGLTTAHRIILAHRGEMQVCSTPGQGTTVDLWLPRWPSD
jgi:signal transduction histidine kinase